MTCAQIGNVGVNAADAESARPFLSGFIVRELLDVPSSWRAEEPLGAYLERHGVPATYCLATEFIDRQLPFPDGGVALRWDAAKEIPKSLYRKMADEGLLPAVCGPPWPAGGPPPRRAAARRGRTAVRRASS